MLPNNLKYLTTVMTTGIGLSLSSCDAIVQQLKYSNKLNNPMARKGHKLPNELGAEFCQFISLHKLVEQTEDTEEGGKIFSRMIKWIRSKIEKSSKTVEELFKEKLNAQRAEDRKTPLQLAVAYNKHFIAQCLLKYGADPNFSIQNDSPLVIAVRNSNHEMVKLLLNNGADPMNAYNISGGLGGVPYYMEALRIAAMKRDEEMVQLLVNKIKPDNYNYPLCQRGSLCQRHLFCPALRRGKEVLSVLRVAMKNRSEKIIDILCSNNQIIELVSDRRIRRSLHDKFLVELKHKKDEGILRSLLKLKPVLSSDVGVNSVLHNAIIYAADAHGNCAMSNDIVKLLIEKSTSDELNTPGKYHLTPLHLAARTLNEEIVTLLLNKQVIVNVQDSCFDATPFHLAASRYSDASKDSEKVKRIVKALFERDASVLDIPIRMKLDSPEKLTLLQHAKKYNYGNIISLVESLKQH